MFSEQEKPVVSVERCLTELYVSLGVLSASRVLYLWRPEPLRASSFSKEFRCCRADVCSGDEQLAAALHLTTQNPWQGKLLLEQRVLRSFPHLVRLTT